MNDLFDRAVVEVPHVHAGTDHAPDACAVRVVDLGGGGQARAAAELATDGEGHVVELAAFQDQSGACDQDIGAAGAVAEGGFSGAADAFEVLGGH